MQSPRSDGRDNSPEAIVIVPLRSLHRGKKRLGTALSEDDRAELIERMARTVIGAANGLPVLVVHDDAAVGPWAEALGATPLAGRRPGLNNAVEEGREHARQLGHTRIIVAHADLPHARDLRPLATIEGIAIVPDLHGDGTNVLSLPIDADFEFAYGPGSFEHHHRNAESSGLAVTVVHDTDLGVDVDHPEDLLSLDPSPPEAP